MHKPKTRYTKSGRINIAYQVIGEGPIDLVYIPGWVSNIDLMWDCLPLARFLFELSKVTRVILFDKRGTGLSDRISELSTLEERMDDIRAVMDAVHSERAILFGHSEGGSVSALFAATYPNRTISLITFGVFAKRLASEDYPWAPTAEDREEVYKMIADSWGSSAAYLESLAPSLAHDKTFMDWLAAYFRSGASPSAALVLTKMNSHVDIIDILESIDVPTLLMYREDDIDVKIEEGKFIAERIKGSKFVTFPGNDHLFWAGDVTSVLEEMKIFIKQSKSKPLLNKVLATILKIEICDLSVRKKTLQGAKQNDVDREIDNILKFKVRQYRGELIQNEQGIIAVFDGPSKAVHCAVDLRQTLVLKSLHLKQGIHIGECITTDEKNITGRAVSIAKDILSKTEIGMISASSTVVNLLSGTGLDFEHHFHLSLEDGKILQSLKLKEFVEEDTIENQSTDQIKGLNFSGTNYTILDLVIKNIQENMVDEDYSMEDLCLDIGISPRQLQRKIKTITNKTPSQLIRAVRLHKAKELMVQEGKTVKEAAYLSGFNSQSYFAKSFKKEFGHLPSTIKAN